MITLNPYVVYKGNCEEAFIFYKQIFVAAELYLGRYKQVPAEARKYFPNAADEHIMHGTLKINEQTVIMGNDSVDAHGQFARDFYLYIDADTSAEATRIFNELAVGGNIIVPIAQSFWSPCYGVLTDKFGVHWKVTSHEV